MNWNVNDFGPITENSLELLWLIEWNFDLQDSADETTTNGSPLHDDNNGENGDSVASVSDAGSGTPPMQPTQLQQQSSVDGDTDLPATTTIATTPTTTSIPLGENTLLVDISDALSEKDKVKFTVHTRTTFPTYAKKDFFVVRQHEEFIWLHDRYEENEEYAGYIVSILVKKKYFVFKMSDFIRCTDSTMSASARFRCKSRKVTASWRRWREHDERGVQKDETRVGSVSLTSFFFIWSMINEFIFFCSEYLATFKKTVAMHEVFLSRLAAHPVFRVDQHLKVFLEYDQDLCAKPRKKIDLFGGLVRSLGKTTDEIYLGATVRDVNDFFESEYTYLTELNAHLKEAATRTERMTKKHKEVADTHIKISSNLVQLSTLENSSMEKFLTKSAEVFEKIRVSNP